MRIERGMYHFRSAHAAASTDAWSCVIDGADQARYGLPYFAQDDKSTTNGLKYKVTFLLLPVLSSWCECIGTECALFPLFVAQTRLYAALVHGQFANVYLFSGNMPAGTNAVVEVIHRCDCRLFLKVLVFVLQKNMHCRAVLL